MHFKRISSAEVVVLLVAHEIRWLTKSPRIGHLARRIERSPDSAGANCCWNVDLTSSLYPKRSSQGKIYEIDANYQSYFFFEQIIKSAEYFGIGVKEKQGRHVANRFNEEPSRRGRVRPPWSKPPSSTAFELPEDASR